jgi:arylsulfatase A-like enzyme
MAAHAADRPNIVFIFSDDHAYQAISAYGHGLNNTPHIDRLGAEGMRFERCYVTNSICGPARAVIQTGKYSHLNGFYRNGNRFDGRQQTFPKLLQKAGYQTAVVGKWHLGTHMQPQGYDYFDVIPGQGHYYNPEFINKDGNYIEEGYITDITVDKSIAWLERRDRSKPFMLMMQQKAPHRAWEPGPAHLTTFDDRVMPEPATLFDDYSNRASPATNQWMTIATHMTWGKDLKVWEIADMNDRGEASAKVRTYGRMNDTQRAAWDAAYGPKNKAMIEAKLTGTGLVKWKYQRYIKDYLRCIQSVDDSVGKMLDYLDANGLTENTVVIYSSDQGFYLGEHGWFDKRWMYEESLRTPLLVRWPGKVKPGAVNRDIVSNLDFAETFLDIAGVEIPGDMQGASLVPVLQGNTPAGWRDVFYYHYYEGGGHHVPRHYGVTDGRRKLIYYYTLDEWEYFDIEQDPNEVNSRYGDPKAQADVAEMMAMLERQRVKFKVTPDPNALRPLELEWLENKKK